MHTTICPTVLALCTVSQAQLHGVIHCGTEFLSEGLRMMSCSRVTNSRKCYIKFVCFCAFLKRSPIAFCCCFNSERLPNLKISTIALGFPRGPVIEGFAALSIHAPHSVLGFGQIFEEQYYINNHYLLRTYSVPALLNALIHWKGWAKSGQENRSSLLETFDPTWVVRRTEGLQLLMEENLQAA